jgi:hypothetical protein
VNLVTNTGITNTTNLQLLPVRGRFQDVLAFLRRFWRFQNAKNRFGVFKTLMQMFNKGSNVCHSIRGVRENGKTGSDGGHLRNGQIVRLFCWTFWRFRRRSER